jgi:hypothetical protein
LGHKKINVGKPLVVRTLVVEDLELEKGCDAKAKA